MKCDYCHRNIWPWQDFIVAIPKGKYYFVELCSDSCAARGKKEGIYESDKE